MVKKKSYQKKHCSYCNEDSIVVFSGCKPVVDNEVKNSVVKGEHKVYHLYKDAYEVGKEIPNYASYVGEYRATPNSIVRIDI